MSDKNQQAGERAKWLQAEFEAISELSKVLRLHIAHMPSTNIAEWLGGLKLAYNRLHEHLDRFFADQREGGYLDDILEERPRLERDVTRLRHEQAELSRIADSIQRDLDETGPDDRALIADVCARIQRFMAIVANHAKCEAMLTQLVFNLDLGAGE
ncbi:MAG: hypothetical protein D6744_13195 [Planctomycetota bacterium]|nr:MAG: hypothetical protein D6744_13195 [Planctomycetota bacterium]